MPVSYLQFSQYASLCSRGPVSILSGDHCRFKLKKRNTYTVFASNDKVQTLLNSVNWDDKGLAVALAQNVDTGAILMQGFVNMDALETTIFI